MKTASIVLGKKAKQKLKQEPLFDNLISSRISDMSNDMLNQVIIDIKTAQQRSQFNWMNPQVLSNAVNF